MTTATPTVTNNAPYVIEEYDGVWTVGYDDGAELHDLNARGEPCQDLDQLADFICELHFQGAFDKKVRDGLLAEVDEAR